LIEIQRIKGCEYIYCLIKQYFIFDKLSLSKTNSFVFNVQRFIANKYNFKENLNYKTNDKVMWNNIIASIRILQMLSNVEAFEDWLKQSHNKILDVKIFQGYKLFIECAFSQMFDNLSSDETLGIKEDFLLQRARGETIFIEMLPNSCERIIFLKNIYASYKLVIKSKNSRDLKEGMVCFQKQVLSAFDELIEKNCKSISIPGLTFKEIMQLILIENLYIHFSQINNNGPVAYSGNVMKQFYLDNNRLEISLDGYKYTLQYVWNNVIGVEMLNSTSLKNIHKADSWQKYIFYGNDKNKQSEAEMIFGESFDLSVQTSLDSYFYRIQDEVIFFLEKKHQINILDVNKWIFINKKGYSKNIFKKLLSKDGLSEKELSISENLDMLFYWYPIEVFQSGQIHNGIPAFITLLAGTVALSENEKEFEKVMVCKFVHPFARGKNDYSYSILIDSKASAGHYYSGWLLYFDCCSDHSGFSGSGYNKVEQIISKYKDLIDLKTLKIEKESFKEYIAKYISSDKNTYETEEEVKVKLDDVSNQRVENTLLDNARGFILELIVYYIHSQKLKVDSIKWNTQKSKGEIDVIIENQDTVTIIECKVNPDNHNLVKEHKKAIAKLNRNKLVNKKFEFWFWHEPSSINKQWLLENSISYTVLSNNCTNNNILKGFDIASFKYLFR